jgi:hypothetical protein
MTPKQKANQLVNKFYYLLPNNGYVNEGINSCESRWKESIMCSLMVVNEIMESREDDGAWDDTKWGNNTEYYTPHPMYLNYWNLVKQEIIHRLDDIS